jgi:hypothetical protein
MRILNKVRIADSTFELCSWLRNDRFVTFNEKNYKLFATKEAPNVIVRLLLKKFTIDNKAKLVYQATMHDHDHLDSAIGHNYSQISKFEAPDMIVYRYLARKPGISNLHIVYYKKKDNLIDIFVENEKLTICHPLDLVVKRWLYNDFIRRNNGLIMHGSAVSLGNKGIIFVGDSGCGKTTLAKLFKASDEAVINDDMLALKLKGRNVYAYSLPWVTNTEYVDNAALKLDYIIFPHFSLKERLEAADPGIKFKSLLRNIYLEPESANYFLKSVDILIAMSRILKQVNLHFSKSKRAYKFLNNNLKKL